MAGKRTAAWRAQIVARVVELRPVVLALMRESVPDELQGFGQATGRQLQALARLPEDGMTMGELAAFLKVTGAAASVLAERLVAQGLAVRHSDPCDRRVVLLAPTPEGMAVAQRYRDNQRRAVAVLLDRLSDAQVAAWLDIMETLAADGEPAPRAAAAEPAGAAR
ncbi:MAG: MarR family winged helix-turn-helix transcriptional regulator [Streptosporangiaceae bacterium]